MRRRIDHTMGGHERIKTEITMKRFIILLAFVTVAVAITAQESIGTRNGVRARLGIGYNIGGTAPMPLPREIREIEGYNPGLNLAIEGSLEKCLKMSPWGIRWGVRIETKGMTTRAMTKNYHMEAWNSDGTGKVQGAWTGKVRTSVKNTYLTVPVVAVYNIDSHWNVSAGAYVSYLLDGEFTGAAYDGYIRDQDPTGEKADVTNARYDFSNDIRKYSWGLQAGGEYRVNGNMALFANLQWGMNSIFPSDSGCVTFALYPIYGTLGVNLLF